MIRLVALFLLIGLFGCKKCETCIVTIKTVKQGQVLKQDQTVEEVCDGSDKTTSRADVYQNQIVEIVTVQDCP